MPSSQLARALGRLVARKDVKAKQAPQGIYIPVDRPWTMKDVDDHISGKRSWGHYLLDTDNNTKMFAFDIDVDKPYRHIATNRADPEYYDLWELVVTMASGLGSRSRWWCRDEFGLEPKVMLSYGGGKGMHVLGVFDDLVPATVARAIAEGILLSFGCFKRSKGDIFWKHETDYPELELEVFPKQTEVKPGGYGNLMRMPLGINPKTGLPGHFVIPETALKEDDPLATLQEGSWR
jgi:hypothetical protein